MPLRDGEEISVVSSLEGNSVANKRSSGGHVSSSMVDPNAKVKLTCSVALLNISLRPDAEAIFLEQVRQEVVIRVGTGDCVNRGPFVRRAGLLTVCAGCGAERDARPVEPHGVHQRPRRAAQLLRRHRQHHAQQRRGKAGAGPVLGHITATLL